MMVGSTSIKRTRTLLAAVLLLCGVGTAHAAPRVLVTIKPIHSLVANVMHGAGEPDLLIQGGESPHSYSLRPSDALTWAKADLVFWVGPELEIFLEGALDALARKAKIVTLRQADGVRLLPSRRGGAWEPDEHDRHDHHRHIGEGGEAFDTHLWLDPRNAEAMVGAIADALAAADPAQAWLYHTNARATRTRLRALDQALVEQLAPVRGRPFLVFHDAYHYLEARYGLNAVGSVTIDPEHQVGVRRVLDVRAKVRSAHAVCAFAEPQFQPALLRTITEGAAIRAGLLDPEGANVPAGVEAYFTLMGRLGDALVGCLARPGA